MKFELLVTAEEFMARAEEAEKALRQKVRKVDGCIRLDGWYDIPERDCNTHRKVVAWIAHLAEKTWVTPEMIGRFIELTVGRERTP